MHIGVFGGTFDPVHLGHLVVAEQCREQAALDEVWFVPAAQPPHKADRAVTPFDRRFAMLELATAGHSAFRVDAIESERSGPSFTVDTLAALRERRPADTFSLILGSDSLADLPNWHEPRRLAEGAGLVVSTRPGWEPMPAEELAAALKLPTDFKLRYQVVEVPLVNVSSRDLRSRVAAGRTIRYLVPRPVEVYIADKRLYLPG